MTPPRTIVVLGDGRIDRARLAQALAPIHGWQTVFCDERQTAVNRARESDAVVIVVAIASPHRVDVLAQLAHEAPHVARVLVIQGDEAELPPNPRAHETVLENADPTELYEAVQRARLAHHHATLPVLDRLVGAIGRLPPLPAAYDALTDAIEAPSAHVAHIADIVETDAVLALRVLQLANSAFFGVARRIMSVHDAIGRLGINMVRTLVLRCHVFETLAPQSRTFSHERFHEYSLRVARLARSFAQYDKEAAFSAGLLLDIGRLVIGVVLPDLFERVDSGMRTTGSSAEAVERVVLGTTHAEIGSYLLDRWRLPFSVVEAVAYHHHPRQSCSRSRGVLAWVHAADALVGMYTCNEPADCIDREFLADAGLLGNLPQWRELARKA